MTLSRLRFLQLLTTPLRHEDEDSDSASSSPAASVSSDDNEIPVESSSNLPRVFFGVPVLREERDPRNRKSQTGNAVPGAPDDGNMGADRTNDDAAPRATDDGDAPLSPWRNSTAKRDIIKELKDETSDIHLFIGNYGPKDWKQVKFEQLHSKYAARYAKSNFRENLKRLLLHFQNKTADFSAQKEQKWYTSPSNVSDGYAFLFALYMDKVHSKTLKNMTAEEIWKSHKLFLCYSLDDFEVYNNNMINLTNRRKEQILAEEESFRRDMLKIPSSEKTSRNEPFWHTHAASELLKRDEEDGTARSMPPRKLWKSRKEYQDFTLKTFRKHIYQERLKQLAAPYWQHKRNEAGEKKRREDTEQMKVDWSITSPLRQLYV